MKNVGHEIILLLGIFLFNIFNMELEIFHPIWIWSFLWLTIGNLIKPRRRREREHHQTKSLMGKNGKVMRFQWPISNLTFFGQLKMDAISLVEYYLLILFFEKIEQLNWTNRARTVLHVRYKSLYISLPSSAKQQREMTKFCVAWRTFFFLIDVVLGVAILVS